MDLSLIFTVPGKPGLYKLISQGKNAAIMESLLDRKRMPVFTMDRISSLAEIAIYTTETEISLANVFRNIFQKENGGKCLSHNSEEKELKDYFIQVLPDFDQERVYVSNIRKVLQWYNILLDNQLVDMELSEREKAQQEALAAHETEETAPVQAEEKKAAQPKKTAAKTAKPAAEKEKKTEEKKPKSAAKPAAAKAKTTKKETDKPVAKKTTAKKEK